MIGAALLGLGACGLEAEPATFRSIDEIPERAGVFTGEDGTFDLVIDRPTRHEDPRAEQPGLLPAPDDHPPYVEPR